MISSIEMHGPATFAAPATLTTGKKVNLIYGLNGSGKSTMCRFLYSPRSQEFEKCRVLPSFPANLYVYNEDFVRENFFETESLKGIFSLSKENKEAEQKIESATKKRGVLEADKADALARKEEKLATLRRATQIAEDALWEVKTNFTGGDRVLEYCLEGLKGKKESLFNYVASISKAEEKPSYTVEQLKAEVSVLTAQNAQPASQIARIDIDAHAIETDTVFETSVIGSQSSIVADLIDKLGNADWVRQGLIFAEHQAVKDSEKCPFCQSKTINEGLLGEIRKFFDKSYEEALDRVHSNMISYKQLLEKVPETGDLKSHQFVDEKLLLSIEQLRALIKANLNSIEKKAQSPALEIVLTDSNTLISQLNEDIGALNRAIVSHNEKLRNKEASLSEIKSKFWALMRWDYAQVIARYMEDKKEIASALQVIEQELRETDALIKETELTISSAQRETVNIDQAIGNINQALVELGIDDFIIVKHDENLYRLQRTTSSGSSSFATLSEGEKMIITLLYFCELCKGRRSATDTADEKIVVFDDPISSLSHIYVFNVGEMIRSTFFKTNIAKQVFVFTHSLYFFYELADSKHDRRKDQQALFRISKSSGQTRVSELKYDEIQNDYQAYWQVANDASQNPALVANCMRNIIDYFFNFVEMLDFNNVFQRPELKANKFQAFCRYMNRESHSFGRNIYDLKEFDYETFKEGLKLVFVGLGYGEHHKKMSTL